MNKDEIGQLKNLLYDTLILDEQPQDRDISLTQNMGVSITKALSKDGVNLVQIQSIVDKKIIVNMVQALKIIDTLQYAELERELKETRAVVEKAKRKVKRLK